MIIMTMLKRYTKEEIEETQHECWRRAQQMGRRKYIWRRGILGYGLPYLAIWTPLFLLFTHRFTPVGIALTVLVCLPICAVMGYVNAARQWKQMLGKYGG